MHVKLAFCGGLHSDREVVIGLIEYIFKGGNDVASLSATFCCANIHCLEIRFCFLFYTHIGILIKT